MPRWICIPSLLKIKKRQPSHYYQGISLLSFGLEHDIAHKLNHICSCIEKMANIFVKLFTSIPNVRDSFLTRIESLYSQKIKFYVYRILIYSNTVSLWYVLETAFSLYEYDTVNCEIIKILVELRMS